MTIKHIKLAAAMVAVLSAMLAAPAHAGKTPLAVGGEIPIVRDFLKPAAAAMRDALLGCLGA